METWLNYADKCIAEVNTSGTGGQFARNVCILSGRSPYMNVLLSLSQVTLFG